VVACICGFMEVCYPFSLVVNFVAIPLSLFLCRYSFVAIPLSLFLCRYSFVAVPSSLFHTDLFGNCSGTGWRTTGTVKVDDEEEAKRRRDKGEATKEALTEVDHSGVFAGFQRHAKYTGTPVRTMARPGQVVWVL